MPKRKQSHTTTITTALRRHLGQRTVLGVAVPVLKAHIDAAKTNTECAGLSEKEIQAGFRELAKKFVKSDYHPTYIQRRLGPRGFLEERGGRYTIRASLLSGVQVSELESLYDESIASLKSAYEERQAVLKKLEETCGLPDECIRERHQLVGAYLSQLAGNGGEMFEVVSFAVLREYFRTFGFSLQRFSTTNANDGGMDFVASNAIYQVTVDESIQKLRRDLQKAPGTKRVLVRPVATPEIVELSESEVLETIELKDLLHHFIAWLLDRDNRSKRPRHLQQVLLIALDEFRRENKAESGNEMTMDNADASGAG